MALGVHAYENQTDLGLTMTWCMFGGAFLRASGRNIFVVSTVAVGFASAAGVFLQGTGWYYSSTRGCAKALPSLKLFQARLDAFYDKKGTPYVALLG